MDGWWESLGTGLQVFYGIAIATSAVLAIQAVLLLLGLDHHGDIDDGDAGSGLLSVRTVTAFFTGFGWAGVAALQAGLGLLPTLVIATAAGSAFMAGVLLLLRGLYSMRYSGTLDYHNAIGEVGRVYLRIPGGMRGPGQIEVTVQGQLRVAEAFTRSPDEIPNQTRVRVVELMDQTTLVVEPLVPPADKTAED